MEEKREQWREKEKEGRREPRGEERRLEGGGACGNGDETWEKCI